MPPAVVLRRQLGAGGLVVLFGAAGAELLRITVAVYPAVCCSVNHKKKTKKKKNKKETKKTNHEFSDENLHFGVDKIHGPKKAKKRSWDFPGR